MNFWFTVFRQLGRNLRQTWGMQLMTLLTVTLSVLIFSFFALIYTNILNVGEKLSDELRLIVYLEEEPGPELQKQIRHKINQFDQVEKISFVSRQQAYERFSMQLGENREVLDDIPQDFLPPSVEIIPLKSLRRLSRLQDFSAYLAKLPGTIKVQYGQDWVEKFNYSTKLSSIVVMLSGALLILTAVFMVAYTIRLTILGRHNEMELLKLVGATNNYIRTPFLLEGIIQGLLGSSFGIGSLYLLFTWIENHFSTPGFLDIFTLRFFSYETVGIIIVSSILLCTIGSYTTIEKFLKY